MSRAKELDQFFTNEKTAKESLESASHLLSELGYKNPQFIEPSAGGGSFVDACLERGHKVFATDIDPKREDIHYANFLEDDLNSVFENFPPKDDLVVIGNPPFGKRSKLAVDFINKSFEYSDTVVFVLPIQFIKHLTMKRIDKSAKLLMSTVLDPDSFTFEDKSYSVRCVLQVWTKRSAEGAEDFRIYEAPPTKHDDFEMFIFNCVPEALWMFDHDWDFAVLRQGWGEFTPVENAPDLVLNKKNQWMFFKSSDPSVLDKIRKIDFNKLGERNTSVRGFGKADVVEEYTRLYGSKEANPQRKSLWDS